MRRRTSRGLVKRAAIVTAGSLIAVVALAGPAFAHVVITPSSAPAGSAAELTFRVANEETKAATVELREPAPEHPAPTLTLTTDSSDSTGTTGTTADAAAGTMDTSGTSGSGGSDVTVAILLGAGGFAVGLVGLVAGLSARQASRQASRP